VKRSNRLLILLGVFLAVIAMVGVVVVAGNPNTKGGADANASPTPTPEPKVQVVVAKTDMALGDKITAAMVETKTMNLSERDALGGDTYASVDQVVGKVAGGTIKKGQVLFGGKDFLQPGAFVAGQDLASSIAAGKVAVSMEVDQVNGVGTLVVPGDRVDVVLSVYVGVFPIVGLEASNATKYTAKDTQDVTTKMVIQNRKVLVTLLPSPEAAAPGPAGASPTPTPKSTAQTVTNSGAHMIVILEVLPEEAEVIRWAQREEKLDPQNYITLGLALRSDKDNDTPPAVTGGITFKQLVSIYGVLPVDPRAIIPSDIAKQIAW
jgi:Flp pilus assembly protein CpaB